MRKPPSPVMHTTLPRPRRASAAAIAAGSPKPMAANPLLMSTVLGSRASQKRATQSLWAPTSLTRTSSGASSSRRSRSTRCGLTGKSSSVPASSSAEKARR